MKAKNFTLSVAARLGGDAKLPKIEGDKEAGIEERLRVVEAACAAPTNLIRMEKRLRVVEAAIAASSTDTAPPERQTELTAADEALVKVFIQRRMDGLVRIYFRDHPEELGAAIRAAIPAPTMPEFTTPINKENPHG